MGAAESALLRTASPSRRDGRVAEGARLESVFRGNSNVGSNPTLSAMIYKLLQKKHLATLVACVSFELKSFRSGSGLGQSWVQD